LIFHFIGDQHEGLIGGNFDQIDPLMYLAALYQPVGGGCLCWLLLLCSSAQTAFDCRSGCVSNRQAVQPMSALTLSFQVFLQVMHEEFVYVQFQLQFEVLISP